MATSGLAKKLKLIGRRRAALINAPAAYREQLLPPAGVELSPRLSGKFDWIQIFVKSSAELQKIVEKTVAAMEPQAILWISFPKRTSGLQTDLTRDRGWESLKPYDLKWLTLVSVNDTWSAFAVRPLKPGEERRDWR